MGIGGIGKFANRMAQKRLEAARERARQSAQNAARNTVRNAPATQKASTTHAPNPAKAAGKVVQSGFETLRQRAPMSLDGRGPSTTQAPAVELQAFRGTGTSSPDSRGSTQPPQNLTEAQAQRARHLENALAAEQAVRSLEQLARERPSALLRMELAEARTQVSSAYHQAGIAAAYEIDFHNRPPLTLEAMEAFERQIHALSTNPSFASGLTTGETQLAGPTDAERVEQAEAEVRRAYETGGSLAAAQELEAQAETLGSPELVDALIAETQDVVEQISAELGDRIENNRDDSDDSPTTKGTIAALARVADLASDDGVAALVGPLARALPDSSQLNQFDDAFNELDKTGHGVRLGLALANELERTGKTRAANEIRGEAVDALNNVRGEYEQARTAREEADARLNQMLAELEGVLTPEQQAQFIENFRAENAEVYAAEVEAAQKLSDTLTQNAAAIDQMVVDDPGRAGDVFKAYEQLAQSPLPAAAVEWAARTMQDGSPTQAIFADRAEDIATKIVEPGMAGTLAQYQAEADGDADSALDRFETLFGQFKTARGFATAPGRFMASLDAAEEFIDAMRAAQQGNPEALEALLADRGKLGQLNGMASSIAAASLVFGIMNLPGQRGMDLVRSVGAIGNDGLNLVTQAIGTLEKTGRLSSSSKLVNGASFLKLRVLPGLGVALSALSTIDAVGNYLADPNNRTGLKAVTSAVALIGGTLALFPPTAPLGVVLAVVSTAVGLIGDAIFGAEDRRKFNEEQQRLLEPILTDAYGDTPEVREAARQIAFGDPDMNALMESTGMTQAQFVELMGSVPDANDRHFPQLIEVLLAAGVEPGEELLQTVQALNEEFDGDLAWLAFDLVMRDSHLTGANEESIQEIHSAWGEEILAYLE